MVFTKSGTFAFSELAVNSISPKIYTFMTLHPQELELYLLGRLPEDSVTTMDSHLSHCEVCRQRLVREFNSLAASELAQLGASLSDEMRKEPRFKTDEVASFQTLSPFATNRYPGQLADVSRAGMKLQTPVQMESGTLIKITLKSVIAFGQVRYRVQAGDVYHYGVQLSQMVQLKGGSPAPGTPKVTIPPVF